jgi:hypothetical protein
MSAVDNLDRIMRDLEKLLDRKGDEWMRQAAEKHNALWIKDKTKYSWKNLINPFRLFLDKRARK